MILYMEKEKLGEIVNQIRYGKPEAFDTLYRVYIP